MIMMRKLAIASLLVAGVALSGSVFAQDTSSAAPASASTSAAPAKHAHKAKSGTTHKTHTKKAASGSEPASASTAGK
jgi:hypothetical protein